MQSISKAAEYTLQFINQTQKSIFLTGKAGTGKTTLLKEILHSTHKNTVVVAPTGIAALNAGGVTIHSMFQLPFGGFIPDSTASMLTQEMRFETPNSIKKNFKMSGQKKAVIKSMELLIIDEVSMLRGDLLDAIDCTLQGVRKSRSPFGGVQVLFIGDLLQLPPVVKDDEWRILKNYYVGKFFFHAHVIQQNPPLYIELDKIFRQSDEKFIAVLNNLRNNKIEPSDIEVLNKYHNPNFDLKSNKGYITLTTHNAKADTINSQSLIDLPGKEIVYKAEITKDFPEKIYPIDINLKLKVGAQVMFIKNDISQDKHYFNGKMAIIKSMSAKELMVHFPEENKTIEVEKYEWNNIKYTVNSENKDIQEEVLGTFVQYPIKLAWAITVHKSQGLTFDKAALDVSQVFMPGQAYVALSRLRSLDGLVLLTPFQMNGISNDHDVMQYANNKADETVLEQSLATETMHFVHQYLKGTFDWNVLAQEWRNHQFEYGNSNPTAAKSLHGMWIKENSAVIWNLLEPATKFMSQLDKLFTSRNIDIQHIANRIEAAFNYFLPSMDAVVDSILLELEAVQRMKGAKALYTDLIKIEDIQVIAVQRLMRARKLVDAVKNNQTINKQTLFSLDIRDYKVNKMAAIKEQFKAMNLSIVEEEEENRYKTVNTDKKDPKKATHLETLSLWQEGKSIQEIAEIRAFTSGTIYAHITKLVGLDMLTIQEVMTEKQIEKLQKLFENYTEESLNTMKTEVGDDFSWEELRLYKMYVSKQKIT